MADVYPRSGSEENQGAYTRVRVTDEARTSEDAPIATLLGDLLNDAQTLVRREVDLAKTEIRMEIDKARQGAIVLGIGAGAAAIGGIFLLLMVVHLLFLLGLPLWASYLIVGAVLLIGGLIALQQGISRLKRVDPVPRETIDSVRKDVEWIKEQNPSDRT